MENNQNVIMASAAQINYLKRLGYTGSEQITSQQASEFINQFVARQNQPQQSGQPQQNTYQQPHQQNNNLPTSFNNGSMVVTRAGESVEITPATVKDYLGVELTQPEFNYFFSVCNLYGLNPFIKDIYPIKFGSQPATFVIDYKVMQQAADAEPMFDGLKVGILFLDANGHPQEREGAYLLPNEILIGAWCDVYRKDRTHTNRTYALYDENKKTTKDGKVTTQWAEKPVFMITKVAKAQALRETFPNMFSNNTYTQEEMVNTNEETKLNKDDLVDIQYTETGTIKPNLEKQPETQPQKQVDPQPQQSKSIFDDINF